MYVYQFVFIGDIPKVMNFEVQLNLLIKVCGFLRFLDVKVTFLYLSEIFEQIIPTKPLPAGCRWRLSFSSSSHLVGFANVITFNKTH